MAERRSADRGQGTQVTVSRVHAVPDEALGNTSYLLDAGSGIGIAIDPRRDIDDLLGVASDQALRIEAVLETHTHADFVSGARELAGVRIYGADPGTRYAHQQVAEGSKITFGEATIEAIATPGHTPDHVSFLVRFPDADAIFTGGSLIAGGVGRTDLSGPDLADSLARAQYRSVQRIGALADDTLVYPTHGAGSFCSSGGSPSGAVALGHQRQENPLIAATDEETFLARLAAGLGSYPPYFNHLPEVNRAGALLLREVDEVPMLGPEGFLDAAGHGAWMIDLRPWQEWAARHIEGSISNELRPAFASWLGWVVPFGEPVVFVGDQHDAEVAIRMSRRIGFDDVRGWLPTEHLRNASLATSTLPVVDPLQVPQDSTLLDIRQSHEVAQGRILGAEHIELGGIIAGKIPEARNLVTYCGHGQRSATAASILARRGVSVANLRGGIDAWRKAGLPIES